MSLDLQQAAGGTLTDLCEELNTPTRPSHRAITDAIATAEVLHRIGATQIAAPNDIGNTAPQAAWN